MLNNILIVGTGGAVGSILRYLCQRGLNSSFPTGTIAVNILGSLIIGLLWGTFSRYVDERLRLLLVTGFCGGFTTFSAFTYEGVQMLIDNRWASFILYTGVSVMAGLLATYIGYKLSN